MIRSCEKTCCDENVFFPARACPRTASGSIIKTITMVTTGKRVVTVTAYWLQQHKHNQNYHFFVYVHTTSTLVQDLLSCTVCNTTSVATFRWARVITVSDTVQQRTIYSGTATILTMHASCLVKGQWSKKAELLMMSFTHCTCTSHHGCGCADIMR
eukprot:1096769-Pleurochrysis_carterae.AAC.2